jgi:hypothetical protein
MAEPLPEQSQPSTPPAVKPRRKWLRRLLWLGAFCLLLLVVLLVALPHILSSGPVRRLIAEKLGASLDAPVEVETMAFSWGGEQRIENLRVGTPATSAIREDLLTVSSITVKQGLLDLVLPGELVATVEVEKPVIRLRRDREGRFSFEGLGGARWKGGEGQKPSDEPSPPSEPSEPGRLPEAPGQLKLLLRSGVLHFRDDLLGTASQVTDFDLDVDLDREKIIVGLEALLGQPGQADAGSVKLDATIKGLKGAENIRDLLVTARGQARDLDLQPYAPLIEKLAGVKPPEKPVRGDFTVETADRRIRGSLDLDADYAALRGVALELPLEAGGGASLTAPYSLDLEPLVAALGNLSNLPPGSHVAGKAGGTLSLTGPLSLEALSRRPVALGDLGLALDLSVKDLVLKLPAGAAATDQRAGTAAEKGRPEEKPLELAEKELTLELRARTGESVDQIRLETTRLRAEGLQLDLDGTVENREASAGARGSRVPHADLRLSADLLVPSLVERFARFFPEGVKVTGGTRARLTDLRIRGPLRREQPPAEALTAEGSVELAGVVSYSGVKVDGLTGKLELAGGVARVKDLQATVNGGQLRSSVSSLGLAGEKRPFQLKLELDGVGVSYQAAPLLAYVLPFVGQDDATLEGKIKAALALEGRGFALEDLKETLKGSGSLRVAEGKLGPSPFLRELAGVLRSAPIDTVLFKEMGSDFTVNTGRVSSDNVFLTSRGGKIRRLGLSGSTSLDQELDYGVNVSALKDSIGDDKIRRILAVLEKTLGDAAIPLRLKGSLTSPSLALDAGKLPRLDEMLKDGAKKLLEDEVPGLDGTKLEEAVPGLKETLKGLLEGPKKEP